MMMERILLVVLYLSGWNVFSTCLHLKYYYVADYMNWTDAQTYCREKYTELATIENTEERNEIINVIKPSGYTFLFWTGLYSKIDWRWSDGYNGSGAGYSDWRVPFTIDRDNYLCATTNENYWVDTNCLSEYSVICNNGTQLDPEFVHVNLHMTWSSAQKYCRENYRDLATVRNDNENQQIQNLAHGGWPWIGLSRVPDIYRSDGNGSFRDLYTSLNPNGFATVKCGAGYVESTKKYFVTCDSNLPFVCYNIPVTRQVVKLRIKPGDSVDLNDDTVKANILKELQDRLKEKGVSGVTLKWKVQPDGKVFHKEGKSSQKKKRQKTEL